MSARVRIASCSASNGWRFSEVQHAEREAFAPNLSTHVRGVVQGGLYYFNYVCVTSEVKCGNVVYRFHLVPCEKKNILHTKYMH